MDKVEAIEAMARALYECERERSDHVDRLLSAAKGRPVKMRMEHWNDVADIYRDDATAALIAAEPFFADVREQWLPIETAPRDGSWIWAFWPVTTFEDQQTPTRWVETSLKDGPYWQDSADHIDWTQPTHWQPLSDPPVLDEVGG